MKRILLALSLAVACAIAPHVAEAQSTPSPSPAPASSCVPYVFIPGVSAVSAATTNANNAALAACIKSVPGSNITGTITQATNVRTNVIDLTKPPYSIDPTGTVDATATIQNAITFNSGPGVEFDLCPSITTGTRVHYKISSTLQIGNGTGSAYSTINQSMRIIMCGADVGYGPGTPFPGGSSFDWYGPSGGTAIQINGPIGSLDLEGFYVDCRDVCATGYSINDVQRSRFSDVWVQNQQTVGWIISEYLNDSTFSGGTQYNVFDRWGSSSYDSRSIGFQLGPTANVENNFDVSGNVFIGTNTQTQTGAVINWSDANDFFGGSISGTSGPAIQWNIATGGNFPGSFRFYGTGFGGTNGNTGIFNVSGASWAGGPGQVAYFEAWNDGGGNNPPAPPVPTNGQEYFSGITSSGVKFGALQPIRYANADYNSTTITSSGLFSAKTYTFPANYFSHIGTTVHVKADLYASESAAGDTIVPYLSLGGTICVAANFTNAPITLASGGNDVHVDFDFNQYSAVGSSLGFIPDGQFFAQADTASAGGVTPTVGLTNAAYCSTSLSAGSSQALVVGATITGTHTSLTLKKLIVTGDYAENH